MVHTNQQQPEAHMALDVMPVHCHAPYHGSIACTVARRNVLGLTCTHMTCITAGMYAGAKALSTCSWGAPPVYQRPPHVHLGGGQHGHMSCIAARNRAQGAVLNTHWVWGMVCVAGCCSTGGAGGVLTSAGDQPHYTLWNSRHVRLSDCRQLRQGPKSSSNECARVLGIACVHVQQDMHGIADGPITQTATQAYLLGPCTHPCACAHTCIDEPEEGC